jgi:ubiquinol-cytochrome c reductase cytochrome c subunit
MTSDTPAGRPRSGRMLSRVFSRRRSAPSRLRRRVGAATRMLAALALAGGVYTAFAPGAFAEDNTQLSAAAQEGKQLFDNSCITCHGRDAQGVEGRGPSLIGVGSASVEFQVGTGRMPMARQEAQAQEKEPQFDKAQTKQLATYVQELGGGPQLPADNNYQDDIKANPDALARGGELFRVNCTSCHGFGGGGGALSSGKYAPSLHSASAQTMYAAMLSGPQSMPVFGDNQLTPDQKRQIITYVRVQLQQDKDPGGFNLGRYGPVTEGLAIFGVGMVILVFMSLWIAGKS